jgi:hypothetical protein
MLRLREAAKLALRAANLKAIGFFGAKGRFIPIRFRDEPVF